MAWLARCCPRAVRPVRDMYEQFAREVQQAGFRDVLLLGMGGSSLCPEVLTLSFGKQAGFPTLAAAVERALQ
jgi:glucose-6-phosphate isomerase